MNTLNKKIIIITSILIAIFLASGFLFKNYPKNKTLEYSKDNEIIRNENQENTTREFQDNEDDFIRLINKSRHEQGLPSLTRNEKLSQSAMKKARDMGENQYFEHVSPEGLQPWFFAEEYDYNYKNFGENLAEGFFNAKSAHEAWMESSGHRDNILSEKFEEVGVAIFGFKQNGVQSFLIVEHFGTQLESDQSIIITCSSKIKTHCEDAERKKNEMERSIEFQEKNIKQLKKDEVSEEEIKIATENLKKIENIKNNLKTYLEECEEYIDKCEKWE